MTTVAWLAGGLTGLGAVAFFMAYARFRLARLDMSFLEFARRLIKGGGYRNLSPAEFEAMYRRDGGYTQIVDLREAKKAASKPFLNAISSPFDNLLKEVVVEGKHDPAKPIVLVCDTGHMSRVAANILTEDAGFAKVYSLTGGTEAWERWQRSASRANACCLLEGLVCCRS